MKYVFHIYTLGCGHTLNTEGALTENAYVYCPECQRMSRVLSHEVHSQEIDDIEEMPG